MSMTVKELIRLIEKLPEDERVENPRVWYLSQQEHWLGWLEQYDGPGAYGRKTGVRRDARYAYNHIVCPEMLLYLIRSAKLPAEIVAAAEQAYQDGTSLMQKSGGIRRVVPWERMQDALIQRRAKL